MRRWVSGVLSLLLVSLLSLVPGAPTSAQATEDQEAVFDLLYPLGWGPDGLFSYARLSPVDYLCPDCPRELIVVVQNVVTDEIRYRYRSEKLAGDDREFARWWADRPQELSSSLDDFGIELGGEMDIRNGHTFSQNGYDFTLLLRASAEMRRVPTVIGPPDDVASLVDPELIAGRTSRDSGQRSWKVIHRGPQITDPRTAVTAARAAGAIIAPDARRAAVVYRWSLAGTQETLDFTVVGAHLGVGYADGWIEESSRRPAMPDPTADAVLREMRSNSGDGTAELVDAARNATRTLLSEDPSSLDEYLHPDLGYFVVYAPGALPTFTHSYGPSSSGVHTELLSEIDSSVGAEDVSFIDSTNWISALLPFHETEDSMVELIEKVEASVTAVVTVRTGPVQRLFFSVIDGELFLTIIDEVVPGEA